MAHHCAPTGSISPKAAKACTRGTAAATGVIELICRAYGHPIHAIDCSMIYDTYARKAAKACTRGTAAATGRIELICRAWTSSSCDDRIDEMDVRKAAGMCTEGFERQQLIVYNIYIYMYLLCM